MHILIAGGTGFIGQALTKYLLTQKHTITVLGRDNKKITQLFGNTVNALTWDELNHEGAGTLKNFTAIINLCGASIGEKSWDEKRKVELINSRLVPTQNLAELCANLGPTGPALFNAGGVGVYGSQEPVAAGLPEPLNENDPINYDRADNFIAYLGRRWEKATWAAHNAGTRVVLMRFGVVLGKNGGALTQMAKPFKYFLGGPLGSGKQPLSWVSMADLLAAIDFLLQHPTINGPVNIVAPECVTQKQFASTLGKVLKKPSLLPTPSILLTALLGEMADNLLLHGQHVVPLILQKNNFKFTYPTLQSALAAIYK